MVLNKVCHHLDDIIKSFFSSSVRGSQPFWAAIILTLFNGQILFSCKETVPSIIKFFKDSIGAKIRIIFVICDSGDIFM